MIQIQKPSFKKIIMTIGNLPSSYVESLSYYECMLWLCNYLENTVIPAVNNNGEAVEELQSAYEQLQEFISDYFDNLDVQTEINNKLDAMAEDGTLTNLIKDYVDPIYQAYTQNINQVVLQQDATINNFKLAVNDELESMDSRITTATSGSPKGVYATVSDLETADPNHNYIYLVTADGKWYYYDINDGWTAGGTYQSSGIAQKGVTILNLDDPLQSNFNMNFSNPIVPEAYTSGYYYVSGGSVTEGSDATWKRFSQSLDVNKIYTYTGTNNASICALIITDNNGDIIYNSNPTPASGQHFVGETILINESGCTAYISIKEDTYNTSDITMFRVLNNIYNNFKIKTNETSIRTINNVYIAYSSTVSANRLRLTSATGYTTDVYQMCKGVTYKITYKGYVSARGYCITDLGTGLIDIAETADSGTKTFTATQDGYIYLSNNSTNVIGSLEILYEAVDVTLVGKAESPLKGKKLVYDGDSIAESRLYSANNGGAYAKIIADNTGGTYVNQAVGGGRLSSTIGLSPARHSVVDNLTNLPTDGDLYCFEGGVNDYFNGVPLGTVDPEDYTTEPDITTVAGALEKIFSYAINNFVGKPIMFVIIHKISDPFETHGGYDFTDLRNILIQVCNKYSIPYYDAYENSGLNGMITVQANNFLNANAGGTADGLHPNQNGYKYYYVPQITKIMESIIH